MHRSLVVQCLVPSCWLSLCCLYPRWYLF